MINSYDILLKVANRLDALGHEELSNRLDSLLTKLATDPDSESARKLQELKDEIADDSQLDDATKQEEGEYYEGLDEILKDKMEEQDREDEFSHLVPDEDQLDSSEKVMMNYNITPMMLNEDSKGNPTSYIGSGVFGNVNRGLYEGKEVAVKVTERNYAFLQRANDEAYVWRKILEIKDRLSPETQRHLPEIHEIFTDPDTDQQVIVMELLEPVDRYALEAVWLYHRPSKSPMIRDIVPYFDNLEWVNNMFVFADRSGKSILRERGGDLTREQFDEIHKLFLNYSPSEEMRENIMVISEENVSEEIANYLKDGLGVSNADPYDMLFAEESSGDEANDLAAYIEMFSDYAAKYMNQTEKQKLPKYHYQYTEKNMVAEIVDQIPEARSLLKALDELNRNGVAWGDLHEDNILTRPGTKDLVLIDVGLYEVEGKEDQMRHLIDK